MTQLRSLLVGLLLALPAFAGESLYVLITPENGGGGGKFGCKFGPEASPPVVKNDLVRFRVLVPGTKRPVQWRVPLYKGPNGDNELAVARVGTNTPGADHTFAIDLNVTDLDRAGQMESLTVQVRTSEGLEAVCSTKAAPVLSAVRNLPPKEITIINGALTR